MKVSEFWGIIFLVQGLAMFFDEFYFHLKRGLPQWERIGHPLDTISTATCFLIALTLKPTSQNLSVYIGLSLFSCLLITKDEFIHKRENCSPAEQWLHSLLFVLHPIVLILAGFIWTQQSEFLLNMLKIQTGLSIFFLIYQISYWSFYAKPVRN